MSTAQLTFWSEELHANPFLSQDCVADWLTHVATWPCDSYSLLTSFVPIGLSGRTSLESCRLGAEGTLAPSSGRWQNSGMGSPTGFWTLSTSEWPKDAAVCLLSQTLEVGNVPQRFFLSPTACKGILRRAEKRQKTLPEPLRLALTAVVVGKT